MCLLHMNFLSYTAIFIDFLFSHSIPQKLCLLFHITFKSKQRPGELHLLKVHSKAAKLIGYLLKIYRNGTRLYILLILMIFNWVQLIICNYALINLWVFKNSSMHVMVVSGAKVTESHITGVGSFASKWDKAKLLMWILK